MADANISEKPNRTQATGDARRAYRVRETNEKSEIYMARAATALREADQSTLPMRRRQALMAADRWLVLARRAERVEERDAG
jgi:hypothetical protein